MKKAIIFDHGGGELANQLWNYASIYAWSLEAGYTLENPSFFEYASYFPSSSTYTIFFKFLFEFQFTNDTRRKQSFKKRIWRNFYKIYIIFVKLFHSKNIYSSLSRTNSPVYLSSHSHVPDPVYFRGWLFRNPIGLEKNRQAIQHFFRPRKDIEQNVISLCAPLREKYSHLVGIHIRQGDYRTWKSGKYFIPQNRIREIINEYIIFSQKNTAEIFFIITSDGHIDEKYFQGLNFTITKNNMVEDLFTLAHCDSILGSDSSFGDFAAYYANIPHIIFKKEPVDWEYYKNKDVFSENKYCTMVHY